MGEARSPNEEFFEVAERIFQNINAVFERDDSLDEFDIVPLESQSNRSPVIHVNHKLALESWCVPFLYSHSFKCFTQILSKRNYNKRQHYHNGSSPNHMSCSSSSLSHKSWNYSSSELTEADKFLRKLHLSRVLVLLNPDLTVAWNFRREAYNRAFTTFDQEINLISLVASRKPKCSDSFSYRRWLIKGILKSGDVTPESLSTLFEGEVKAAESAARRYFSNYHAWNYRLWLLETFLELSSDEREMKYKFLESEKNLSDDWIENHVSDYSGFHYRQQLLQKLSKVAAFENFNSQKTLKIFQHELDSNMTLISRFPGHESLWYHRRFMLQYIVPKLQTKLTENQSQRNQMETDDGFDDYNKYEVELNRIKNKEEDLVKTVLLVNSPILQQQHQGSSLNFITRDSSELNIGFSQKHTKWLFMMFQWVLDNNH